MMKILVQRLDAVANQSGHAHFAVGSAIAATIRRFENGGCDYVFLRVASPEHIDVGFLREVETSAVVVDVELEAPESVQAEFDYVVTVRPGQSTRQQLAHANPDAAIGPAQEKLASPHVDRADPASAPPPLIRGLLHRLMKARPLGQPASS